MERFKASDTLIALDLDDTLYREADYRLSGFHAVARLVRELYGKSVDQSFGVSQLSDTDWLATICDSIGAPDSVKEQLLWAYRLHTPAIKLDTRVSRLVKRFESIFAKVVILTDGRAITQRLKLNALGLNDYSVYISEECGVQKPDPARFSQVMDDCHAGVYVYVGDNPQTDFVAPNALGWITFGLRGNRLNIHAQDCETFPDEYRPCVWLNRLEELENYIC